MPETFRKSKILKLERWILEQHDQCKAEAELIERESGLYDPQGIALRAKSRAYDDVLRQIVKEFLY